jgi:amino acid adenylation domain-containing protein
MPEQRDLKPSFSKFTRAELERSLTERFQHQVDTYPDRVAIGNPDDQLTYDELNRAANMVARAVMAVRPGREKPVALFFHSDTAMIIALLGVLKAGRYSVPLDPSHPNKRNSLILEETQVDLLITNDEEIHRVSKLAPSSTRLLNIDDMRAGSDVATPDIEIPPDALAFVLYTSGTTGHPKGVVITHRFLMHLVMYHTNTRHISAKDRLSALTRCHHIGGIADVFRTLLNGAALYPYDLRTQTINKVIKWLVEERITILHCVPTIFRTLVHALPEEETLPDLRLLHLGGEPVTRRDIELYQARFSNNCILVNNLGSSETGPLGQYFVDKETQIQGDIVPVHLGVEDKEIFLVDESAMPVGNGVIGEIAVKSQYMSPGYWSKSDQVNTRSFVEEGNASRTFLTGDLGRIGSDGMLVYVGRKDNQVNVRGFRVDLTEIEANIRNLGVCKDVAVLAQTSEQGESRIVTYAVPMQGLTPSASTLRSKLSSMIPSYMIPAEFIFLESFPKTASGKVDRLALPSEGLDCLTESADHIAPRDELERELAQLWEELLNKSVVGIKDRFLDLGGDSMFVFRLLNRMEERWGIELSINDIFDYPTVEELGALISRTDLLYN